MTARSIALALCATGMATLGMALPSWAEDDFDCTQKDNIDVAETLKPLIESAKLCKGLKQKVDAGLFKVKLKIDRTKLVRVDGIKYCTSPSRRRIDGTVTVTCETDEDEEVHIEVTETFDVRIEIGNTDCKVATFRIEPEGDIGKLIAKNSDFESKTRKAVERQVAKACDDAS